MSALRRFAATLVGLALALSLSGAASAGEPTAADRETARAQLQQGDKAMDAGKPADALPAYKAAHALLGLPATAMAVVRAQIALGNLVQAREAALAVAKIAKPAGGEKPANVEARKQAEATAAELATRIPSIQVVADAPKGTKVTVEIDGVVLPSAGAAERVNPGQRTVRATAPGFRTVEQLVDVKEREAKQVTLKLEADTGGASATASAGTTGPTNVTEGPTTSGATTAGANGASTGAAATGGNTGAAGAPAPAKPPTAESDGGGPSGLLIGGIVVGGVGVVGLVVGGALGAVTMSELSNAEEDATLCPDKLCTPAGRDAVESAKTKGIVSTVGFAVGGAALATGVILIVVDATSGPSPKESAWTLAPGPGDIGLGAAVTF